MSSPGSTRSAAWRAHGPGIITVAVDAAPSRSAVNPPAVAAWVDPTRSALRISSRLSGSEPRAWDSDCTDRNLPGYSRGTSGPPQAPQSPTPAAAAMSTASSKRSA